MGQVGGMLSPPQGFLLAKPQLQESWEQLCSQLLPFSREPWVQRRRAEALPPTITRMPSRDWRCSQP